MIPSSLKFWTCEKASSSSRDTIPRTEAAEVLFHDRRSFFDRDSGLTGEALDYLRVVRCN